jgi:hypothetical protein
MTDQGCATRAVATASFAHRQPLALPASQDSSFRFPATHALPAAQLAPLQTRRVACVSRVHQAVRPARGPLATPARRACQPTIASYQDLHLRRVDAPWGKNSLLYSMFFCKDAPTRQRLCAVQPVHLAFDIVRSPYLHSPLVMSLRTLTSEVPSMCSAFALLHLQ